MGQYFMIMNLDKGHRIHLGKFGELYNWSEIAKYLCDDDPQYCWAGDRLLLLGDYADDLPTGVMTSYEEKFEPAFEWVSGFPSPREDHSRGYSETSVLRNLCTREYIRADLFPCETRHPDLGAVLNPRLIWTSDPSLTLRAEIDIKGDWAGARFDIVEFDVIKDDPVWKDVTEANFFQFYAIWDEDMGGPDNCTCSLCEKYRNEREEFYENRVAEKKRERRAKPVKRVKPISVDPSSSNVEFGEQAHSPNQTFPAEVQELIFAHLPAKDLAACALASKALYNEAMRALYASVKLFTAEQTKALLDRLKKHPKYANYIKELRVVTMAHWESLQVAHEILKKLPKLESLEFAPCWFSYGDLPYWEYPFALRSLKWGLRSDQYFERFRNFHPHAEVTRQ